MHILKKYIYLECINKWKIPSLEKRDKDNVSESKYEMKEIVF